VASAARSLPGRAAAGACLPLLAPCAFRPGSLWVRVVALAFLGAALLCLVGAGVAGAAPFAK
jgi:hypothetical protein